MKRILVMRNCFIVLGLFLWSSIANAQVVFWTEDFGTGCNQGQLASSYVGINGAWTITNTGTNGNYANQWYVSATENGNGAGNCGSGCGSNRTLHVGNIYINYFGIFEVPADGGARYYAGGLVGYGATTDRRVESPTINCTGRSNITLSFEYMEFGEGTLDNATLWYYDGTTWTQLADLPKTLCCGGVTCDGFTQGLWTTYSIALPASANNNPNVKIGFRWVNDNNSNGTDPSFAVDNITLSVPSAGTPPVANFIASDSTICVGQCINFTDLSTGNPTSWQWTFTGATPNTSTQQNPTNICYNTPGTYTVQLIVSNGNGNDMLVKTNYITVYALPNVTATASPATICSGGSSTLTASGASTYSWSSGQNTSSISVMPTSTTTYTVTGTDANGCSNTANVMVVVNALPTVSASATPASICQGDQSTLSASGANSYTWDQGLGAGQTHIVTPPTTTTYTVTGTDGNGCSNTARVTVSVSFAPTASITGDTVICQGGSTLLTASGGTGTYSYQWNTGATTQSITVSPLSSTTYSVTVSAGSCFDVASVNVTVNSLPSMSATATPNAICVGEEVTLSASGATSYTWDQGLGGGQTHNVSPTSTTTYTVTGTDGNGCSNTAGVTVTVHSLPMVVASATPNPVCEGGQTTVSAWGASSYVWDQGLGGGQTHDVSLSSTTTYVVTGTDGNGCSNTAGVTVTVQPAIHASIVGDTVLCYGESTTLIASGGTSYEWSGAGITDPSASQQVISPTASGVYTVTVVSGACSDVASVYVTVHSLPVASAGDDTTIVLGSWVQLHASGGVSYTWYPPTGLSCTDCSDPVASPEVTTEYRVTVTDGNGCSATDGVLVRVELNCGEVFVPDAFSPNGDGNNDEFKVFGNCIKTINLKIYDRWGNKIFETSDVTESWKGDYKGKELNAGTYTYVYSGTLVTGESIQGKGVVVLIK